MNFCLFYHSLVSDWNHGNAHFLRGVVSELQARGHRVRVYEPADGWSRQNLLRECGPSALRQFQERYPELSSICYVRENLKLEKVAAEADVILVHEWNEPWLVNGLAELHDRWRRSASKHQFRLLFHDTHHRSVSDPAWLNRFRLDCFDGILVFGQVLSEVYRRHGWNDSVWTWHEAADTRRFRPRELGQEYPMGDLVWIGNWGDDERRLELEEFIFKPVQALKLKCHLYGVRYPEDVLHNLKKRAIRYCGWLPNYRVPEVYASHAVTVHVPRRYYAETLPGIPTIRPFEAMACGIPLITSPWQDSEGLFQAGKDYLIARDSAEMQKHLTTILNDRHFARHLAAHALATIRVHHTCAHRVDQLLEILTALGDRDSMPKMPAAGPQQLTHNPRERRPNNAIAKS
ncbi:MAG: glycosyltransferase [Desulfobacterales bacterium GWB2_56_26]|nr:MAG: glycosyltransferase [Desulfobacterales bacterium GWB2_56_26]